MALYNTALRLSKSIRADLENLASSSTPDSALLGQITTSLTSFSRTLDDYQRSIDIELVPDKQEKGRGRISNFRQELLEYKSRFAELKHEHEHAQHTQDRNELIGRRGPPQDTANPYSDSALSSARGAAATNPLFRTNNPNFAPSTGANPYSSYQSPYGLGGDQTRESHALREQSFFTSSNATLDEYLERGRAVLGDLGDQREMLKNTQRKLYSIGTTLGVSGDTIRMVERRAKQDKWIFWGGVVVFVGFCWLVLHYLR